jgi:hypothetical protein
MGDLHHAFEKLGVLNLAFVAIIYIPLSAWIAVLSRLYV